METGVPTSIFGWVEPMEPELNHSSLFETQWNVVFYVLQTEPVRDLNTPVSMTERSFTKNFYLNFDRKSDGEGGTSVPTQLRLLESRPSSTVPVYLKDDNFRGTRKVLTRSSENLL